MHLPIVRLNNALPVRTAYGERAFQAALDHLRQRMDRHFGTEGCRVDGTGVALCPLADPFVHAPMLDSLCLLLEAEPFRFEGDEILLSLSAGAVHDAMLDDVALPAECYREDMQLAVSLLKAVRSGTTHLAWRPIASPRDPGAILYHEACLRRIGEDGVSIDCAEAHAALDRLGLTHRFDRRLLSDMVDALEADPFACLSVALSAQGLSRGLHGGDGGWSDLLARLKRDRGLARRLVIEIIDRDRMLAMQDVQSCVRHLQALGVRIAIGRFGTGQASVGELMALAPDIVKLDGAFLQRAYGARIGHLIGLARTIGPTVIVDGVDSGRHLQTALEAEAEWVAGELLGRSRFRRASRPPSSAPAIQTPSGLSAFA